MTQKDDVGRQITQARLIQDFYKGVGHDYSAGDPTKWDIEDFSEEELAEYIAQYPELEGVDQGAFYEGMKTRGAANVLGNMTALNAVIDQAKTATLNANIKQLEFDTKNRNVPVAQIEADIDNIESGVHNILGSQAQDLNASLFAPAIQASVEWVGSQEPGNPEGDEELKNKRDLELMEVGAQITMGDHSTDEFWAGENLRLGKLLVLGNSNYINSVKGHLKGTEDLNYLGYVDALQEIQMYAENARRQLESGSMTTEQYLAYKNNLEQIVGTSLDDFSSNMDVIFQAANVTETKGKQLAIKGMGDAFTEYTPTIDYDIDEDYISLEAAEAAAQKAAMSNIVLPDSTSILPDTTIISADSLHIPANTEVVIDSLNQIPESSYFNKQQKIIELNKKRDALEKAGFIGTEEYEDMGRTIKALNQEIRKEQKYEDYMIEMELKLAGIEGQMLSDEEIAEISAASGVSEFSLREYMKRGKEEKVLEILSNIPGTPRLSRKAAYEKHLQK
jgi:hypothetical protein